MKKPPIFLFLIALLSGCDDRAQISEEPAAPHDPHSYSEPAVARTTHLALELSVDFDEKKLNGVARWNIETSPDAGRIVFDTRQLTVERVTLDSSEQSVSFSTENGNNELLGQALIVPIRPSTTRVNIYYHTSSDADALGWMEPSMTAGGQLPYLFTQGQAILTRTWIPCQDSPGIRFSYEATVKVPKGMLALMSAENPQGKTSDGVYHFRMPQVVPSYLIALAVGDITFRSTGQRTGVYAEPALIEKAAWEFLEMGTMLEKAESLYGPYRWDRYDLLVLPPGFPFGGMENPRLTFATPTVIAGDRSLVSLVAHELAHSWSGNLVTNATWNDFWLNEGFTVYIERRIMEAVYGEEYTEMLATLEHWELLDEIESLGTDHPDTKLKLELSGRDPDDGMTDIAYQKGAAFLKMLEEVAGRERFDSFLKSWFSQHAFSSVSTEDFHHFLRKNLLEKFDYTVNVDEWIYGTALPANCPVPYSERLDKAAGQAARAGTTLPDTSSWSAHEWVHFIRHLPKEMDEVTFAKLESAYGLSRSVNAEIRVAWLEMAIRIGQTKQVEVHLREFLQSMGRRRFLLPLYRALLEEGHGAMAQQIFSRATAGYHAVSRNSVEKLLKSEGQQ